MYHRVFVKDKFPSQKNIYQYAGEATGQKYVIRHCKG